MTSTKRVICIDRYLALATVKCGDKQHRIGLTVDGKLSFFDHNSTDALEEKVRVMGRMPPGSRCAAVQQAWIENDRYRLPKELREWCNHFHYRGHKDNRKQANDPLVEHTARERARWRVIEQASKSLRECAIYHRSSHHTESVRIAAKGEDLHILCYTSNKRSGGKYSAETEFRLTVGLGWFQRVYRRDHAIIDGHFVVDVINERPLIVRALKQSRGYNLILTTASVGRNEKLKWI